MAELAIGHLSTTFCYPVRRYNDPVSLDPLAPQPASSDKAIRAFLRGIERRARVFSEAQCGSKEGGGVAVAAARARFVSAARSAPLGQWPRLYWTALLSRRELAGAKFDDPAHPLYQLSPGPRSLLLLRLAAGMDTAHAAGVLGVSEKTAEMAISRAIEELHELGVGNGAIERWRGQFQARLRDEPLTEPDMSTIDSDIKQLNEVSTTRSNAVGNNKKSAKKKTTGMLALLQNPALWAGLSLLLALTLLGWFLYVASKPAPADPPAAVETTPQPLTAETTAIEPATSSDADQPFSAEALAISDPDFALVDDLQAAHIASELPRLSWFAARQGAQLPIQPSDEKPVQPAEYAELSAFPAPVQELLAPSASAWAQIDAPTRQRLLQQAASWLALTPAQRRTRLTRYQEWSNLPYPQRAERRAAWAGWAALPRSDQQQLRAARKDWQALAQTERETLTAEFEKLDAETQLSWGFGPSLGAQMSLLAPLLRNTPTDQRQSLLGQLQSLDSPQRDRLGELIKKHNEGQLNAMRRRLLDGNAKVREGLLKELAPAAAESP